MLEATSEASALDTYYAATNGAKELVGRNLWDGGMATWERALENVAPHISPEKLNALERDFYHFSRSRRDEKGLDDTDSDSSDNQDETGNSRNEGGNDSPDVDGSAMIEDYQAEHMKLAKRPTMRLHRNIFKLPSRSSTFSILERRGTAQISRTNLRNDDDRSYTPRGYPYSPPGPPEEKRTREPTTSSQLTTASDPIASPVDDESSFSGSPKDEDKVVRSSAPPHPSTTPGGLMGSKENSDWFGNLESTAHDFVYGTKREFWPTQPVKVAILDSGFALTGAAQKAMKAYSSRIKDKKTFTHEFPSPTTPLEKQRALDDLVGHGTTVAYQLMRTCPSAHVYVAKVTVAESADKEAVPDKSAVARAIRHAVTSVADGGWGVDVINMSFGWGESELPGTAAAGDGISGAIEFAEKQGVLLFAAASNYGLSELNDVFYPARDPRVISVDAEDGLGNPAPFALHSLRGGGGVRYCAPGLSVHSPVSAAPMCGSSFACPVAAGVAALVLEFARHKDVSLSKSQSVRSALSSAQGISILFMAMSQQAANHPGFKMLYPWHFLRHAQRERVALDIVKHLEVEFGKGKVGHEITWTIGWQTAALTTPIDGGVVQVTPAGEDIVLNGLQRATIS